ncbi:MAG: anti-sigma factor family protein [Planctomycetota bacterium]|jgi:anti-sigma factor RsiW
MNGPTEMPDDTDANPTPASPPPHDVRRYVDGELAPAETAAFEERLARDSELTARVRSERALRGLVERAMDVETPADLAERVRASLDDEPIRVGSGGWLEGPKRANVFAVAASIALIAGAVLFGILAPSIDELNTSVGTDLVAETIRGVADEHHRCASLQTRRDAKVRIVDPKRAVQELVRRFGEEVPVIDLEPMGYRFVGLGEGLERIPESMQLVYTHRGRGSDGCPEGMLSIFVMPVDAGFDALVDPLAPEVWRTVGNQPECRQRVTSASRGSLEAGGRPVCRGPRTGANRPITTLVSKQAMAPGSIRSMEGRRRCVLLDRSGTGLSEGAACRSTRGRWRWVWR